MAAGAGRVARSAGADQAGRVRHHADHPAFANRALVELPASRLPRSRRPGGDRVSAAGSRPSGLHGLRLDGQDQQVAAGDDFAVRRRSPATNRHAPEGLTGRRRRIAGQTRSAPLAAAPPRQRPRHSPPPENRSAVPLPFRRPSQRNPVSTGEEALYDTGKGGGYGSWHRETLAERATHYHNSSRPSCP